MVALTARGTNDRLVLACLAIILVIAMVLEPKTVFDGATLGMKTWWNIVFPALLPFFIVSELLMNLGVAQFAGVLLEPVMRPVFRLPGAASFPVAVGYSSGYPIGASITSRLRHDNLISRGEGEHLLTFTNNASPLFVLVAVAVGMFQNPAIGPFLLLIHYASNLLLGLLFRFYAPAHRIPSSYRPGLWQRAVLGFLGTNGRPGGEVLGDAVRASINKLLVIGGYIILFAVIIRLLNTFGILDLLGSCLALILIPLGFERSIIEPLTYGVFEMTLGTRLIAECNAPLVQQLIAVQIVLAWSGLSIQAQVAGFVAGTDIRPALYFVSRCLHAILAALLTYILFPLCGPEVLPAIEVATDATGQWFTVLQASAMLAVILPFLLLSTGLTVRTFCRLFNIP